MATRLRRWLTSLTMAPGARFKNELTRPWSVVRDRMAAAAKVARRGWPWWQAWQKRHPTAAVAAIIVGVIAIVLGPFLWWIGGWALIQETTARALTAFHSISDPEKTVEAYGKLVGAVGLLVAAPFGLLGVGLAFWRTWNQHRDGVVAARKLEAESYAKAAEAFAKAVDHLGNEKTAVRMGAILALEALGKAEPRLLSQAIEILCAVVRDNRPVPTTAPAADGATGEAAEAPSGPVRLPTDIQLIVDIIGRLKRQDAGGRILVDLSGSDLRGADLGGVRLGWAELGLADLSEATLYGATLIGANLYGATLSRANLYGAILIRATLSRAALNGAVLSGVDLGKANLNGANLNGAKLIETDLSGADLTKAKLVGASLIAADLTKADLSGADLRRANLREAKLEAAIFKDTYLPGGALWSGEGPPPDPVPVPAAGVAAPVP